MTLPLPTLVERLYAQADEAERDARMADCWNMREAAARLNAANQAMQAIDTGQPELRGLRLALAGEQG